MAKADSLSTMERHVEKLVLLVCLLALAFAAWYWIVSSPLEVEITKVTGRGTQSVSPAGADDVLKGLAEDIQRVYKNTERAKVPVPVWVGQLDDVRAMAPLPTESVDLATPRLPLAPVAPVGGPGGRVDFELLAAAMPVPEKPVMMASVELPQKSPLEDVVLARGVGIYPLTALGAKWRGMLKTTTGTLNPVVPYKVIVQVQQAPPDGDWAKAETKVVQTPPMLNEKGDPIEVPTIPDFDGTNTQEVRDAREAVRALAQQILQPIYRPVWQANLKQWGNPKLPMSPVSDAPAAAPTVAPTAEVPTPEVQVGIAFYDDSTMTLGTRFRYRIQLVVINPLLTYDEAVAEDKVAGARKKFVTSKPSEWSDSVSVGREVHFFVTGANVMASKMSVTVYARKWGQWVKKKFNVQRGEPIGGVEKVALVDPMGQGRKYVEVDFSTGAIALRLDFKKSLLRAMFTTNTQEMLYLDSDGKLRSRLKTWDDDSPLRERLEKAAKQAAGD